MSDDSDYGAIRDVVMEVVRDQFRLEFNHRINEAVIFHTLKKERIRMIAEFQIGLLRERLGKQDLELELSTSALDRLGDAGFDPVYGAAIEANGTIAF